MKKLVASIMIVAVVLLVGCTKKADDIRAKIKDEAWVFNASDVNLLAEENLSKLTPVEGHYCRANAPSIAQRVYERLSFHMTDEEIIKETAGEKTVVAGILYYLTHTKTDAKMPKTIMDVQALGLLECSLFIKGKLDERGNY